MTEPDDLEPLSIAQKATAKRFNGIIDQYTGLARIVSAALLGLGVVKAGYDAIVEETTIEAGIVLTCLAIVVVIEGGVTYIKQYVRKRED